MQIDYNEIDTAISTWSGFVYQGKIALYHVLKLLAENRESDLFKLQLDSLEDFAILDDCDNPLTLHQIKALKSNYYSTYKGAFEKLQEKKDKYKCDDVYFHYAVEIADKTVPEIEKKHSPIKIYKYKGGQNFCELDSIDSYIESLIKLYYETNDSNDKVNSDYLIKTRNYLEELVLKQVIYIHNRIHKSLGSENENAYTQTISFENFKKILAEDLNQKGAEHTYYLHLTRNDFNRYFQDFCLELEDDEDVSDINKEKLNRYLSYINELDNDQMVKFIRRIMPHRVFKLDSIIDYKDNNIIKDELKYAFFKTLHKARSSGELNGDFISWLDVNGNNYIPTTINTGPSQKETICKNIIKNVIDTDLEVAFEEQQMITSDLDVDSIYETAGNIKNLDLPKKNSDRITQWKKVSLISLNNAKDILNEDNN